MLCVVPHIVTGYPELYAEKLKQFMSKIFESRIFPNISNLTDPYKKEMSFQIVLGDFCMIEEPHRLHKLELLGE